MASKMYAAFEGATHLFIAAVVEYLAKRTTTGPVTHDELRAVLLTDHAALAEPSPKRRRTAMAPVTHDEPQEMPAGTHAAPAEPASASPKRQRVIEQVPTSPGNAAVASPPHQAATTPATSQVAAAAVSQSSRRMMNDLLSESDSEELPPAAAAVPATTATTGPVCTELIKNKPCGRELAPKKTTCKQCHRRLNMNKLAEPAVAAASSPPGTALDTVTPAADAAVSAQVDTLMKVEPQAQQQDAESVKDMSEALAPLGRRVPVIGAANTYRYVESNIVVRNTNTECVVLGSSKDGGNELRPLTPAEYEAVLRLGMLVDATAVPVVPSAPSVLLQAQQPVVKPLIDKPTSEPEAAPAAPAGPKKSKVSRPTAAGEGKRAPRIPNIPIPPPPQEILAPTPKDSQDGMAA